jgi:hypothetical protein
MSGFLYIKIKSGFMWQSRKSFQLPERAWSRCLSGNEASDKSDFTMLRKSNSNENLWGPFDSLLVPLKLCRVLNRPHLHPIGARQCF